VRRALKVMRVEDFFSVAPDALEARALIEARARERFAFMGGDTSRPLALSGEITATHGKKLSQCISTVINRPRLTTETTTINLASVRFMDSGGVKLLMRVVDRAHTRGIRLRFSEPSAPVRNVLRIAKLEHLVARPA